MNALERYFNQMNRRERRLVALCAIVVVSIVSYTVVCQPLINGIQKKQVIIKAIKQNLEGRQLERRQSNIPIFLKKEARVINGKSLVENLRIIFPPQQFSELNQLDLSFEDVQNYIEPLEKTLCQYQIHISYEQGLRELLELVSNEPFFIERLRYKANSEKQYFDVTMSWLSKGQDE